MSFNQALLITFVLAAFIGYFQLKTNDENISETSKREIVYAKADFKLFNSDDDKKTPRKILVPIQNGSQIVSIHDIFYCAKQNNRVAIHTESEYEPILTTLTLSGLKNQIVGTPFIHSDLKSYLINYEYINKIIRTPKDNQKHYDYHIIMDNRDTIKLPEKRVTAFISELEEYIQNY